MEPFFSVSALDIKNHNLSILWLYLEIQKGTYFLCKQTLLVFSSFLQLIV
jgi:hypothetical protein